MEVSGSPATVEYFGRRLVFAWQQHLEHISLVLPWFHFLRGRCNIWSTRKLATIESFGRPFVLRGRCTTWSTSVSFCVAGAALGAPSTRHDLHNPLHTTSSNTPSSTQHHLYNIITTPSTLHHQTQQHQQASSTQHHQHNLINTSPSRQHHPHNTIYTIPST